VGASSPARETWTGKKPPVDLLSGATAQPRAAKEIFPLAESGRATQCAQRHALKCRTDLERNNADVIVLAMTSLAQLLTLGTQMARPSGNRVKLLSRKSAASPALNRCAWRNLRPIQRRNRQEPGPTFTPGRSPLPAVALGETPSKTTSFGEQYSRHLVDVKCITLHLVFYAFPARTKRVTPFWSAQILNLQGLDEASGVRCHLFREPCANTLFAIRSSALRRAPANEVLAPQLKARKLTHPLDSSPAMQPIQRPFSVQLCG
jgi:hypothetical protein